MNQNSPSKENQFTVPDGTLIRLHDFNESEDTTVFANGLNDFILALSQEIDLARLDGVTVAWDFAAGLASLDRSPDSSELTFTNNAQLRCVAKAVPVVRNGTPMVHVVYGAPYVVSLVNEDDPPYQLEAKHILAHECGHVTEQTWYDEAFPERGLDKGYPDTVGALLSGTAEVMWSEYAACRLTARYGEPESLKHRYAQSLLDVALVASPQAKTAIQAFRSHGNVDKLLQEAGATICEPLRLCGYLLGHLDGNQDDTTIDCLCPTLPKAYADLSERSRSSLRKVWDSRGHWESYDATFHDLRKIAEAAMNVAGVFFEPLPYGGTYVSVPSTAPP